MSRIRPILLLIVLLGSAPLLAKEVHLVPPEHEGGLEMDAWKKAIYTLKEGDAIFLGDKVYHLGKFVSAMGAGAVVFMDADSHTPAVIKIEKSPPKSRYISLLSLKVQFETLKELEGQGVAVAKPLELGPEGVLMRQALAPGVTAEEYFNRIFWSCTPEQKQKAIDSIDRLFHFMATRHLLTADLHAKNLTIDPETGAPTIIDPGPILPGNGLAHVGYLEEQLSLHNHQAAEMFKALEEQHACLSTIGSVAPESRQTGK